MLTTTAPEQDVHALDPIHTALADQKLLPGEHLVDAGYITPQVIHHPATEHAVTVIGPVREDPRASEHPGFTKEDFVIDRQARTRHLPARNHQPALETHRRRPAPRHLGAVPPW
ncbi:MULTISPECIES: hypothetical protein [Nocardia]|uniref:hypothetical protein n=1 Tax=Nocardia TaxID=1817 RepID=UPI001E4DE817|nr:MULTISPECIES: hypothetical protein [Nocardia]